MKIDPRIIGRLSIYGPSLNEEDDVEEQNSDDYPQNPTGNVDEYLERQKRERE